MPEIFSTGRPEMPIWIRPIGEEPHEVIRATAGQSASLASIAVLKLKDPVKATGYLERVGMGNENAQRIVDAAQKLIPEVGVRFKVIFESGGIGGPRSYTDFEPF